MSALGKSTRPPSSAICRAAAGPASGSGTCVPSPGGAWDRDSTWDLTAQQDRHPSSSRGKAGAQREAIAHGDFLSSPGQGSRETHGTRVRSLGPSSPELTSQECRALGRQRRLSRAPDLCRLPAASFLLQQMTAGGGDAQPGVFPARFAVSFQPPSPASCRGVQQIPGAPSASSSGQFPGQRAYINYKSPGWV